MSVTVFNAKGSHAAELADLPKLLKREADTIWVDLEITSDDAERVLREVFSFHPLSIEDTLNRLQRAKVEEYSSYVFLILNPVGWQHHKLIFREVDIFLGANYLVTLHDAGEPAITETQERLERTNGHLDMSPSYLLYLLLDAVVDGYFPVLDEIEREIEALGNLILSNPQRKHLSRLFELKRSLAKLWRVVWPQREIPNRLFHRDLDLIDMAAIEPYLRDVSDHLMWIADMVTTFRDTLTGVMDLYMSAVSNRLNTVVNRLTVITVAIGMLTVISGFYGMNFAQTWPPFDSPYGVPFVLGLMALGVGGLLFLFKRQDWF